MQLLFQVAKETRSGLLNLRLEGQRGNLCLAILHVIGTWLFCLVESWGNVGPFVSAASAMSYFAMLSFLQWQLSAGGWLNRFEDGYSLSALGLVRGVSP